MAAGAARLKDRLAGGERTRNRLRTRRRRRRGRQDEKNERSDRWGTQARIYDIRIATDAIVRLSLSFDLVFVFVLRDPVKRA